MAKIQYSKNASKMVSYFLQTQRIQVQRKAYVQCHTRNRSWSLQYKHEPNNSAEEQMIFQYGEI